jgi:DNA-binding transcriptional LysR family regulator
MFEPTHLESFLAVAQTRNFTEAGRRLGLQQSTVSQHIRKLEAAAGRRLFVRDTHSVRLTADGEAMTRFAQSILDAGNRARPISPARACAAGCGSASRRISSPRACLSYCASSSRSTRWSTWS